MTVPLLLACSSPSTSAGVVRPGHPTDPSTLEFKHLVGYQGWFAAPGDGSPANQWVHWFEDNIPDAKHVHVDFWPDLSELDADELFPTELRLPDGDPALVFSEYTTKTALRHFKWLADYDLDGALVYRFIVDLIQPDRLAVRDRVLQSAMAGSEANGRVFAVRYDIAGAPDPAFVDDLVADWMHVVDDLHVTQSPNYLMHKGKPVVVVAGLGLTDRPGTPVEGAELIARLTSPSPYAVTLVGVIPSYWRTLDNDSKTDPAWASIYRSFDVISPWTVGRYADLASVDAWAADQLVPDMAEAARVGKQYMPIVFPGFSWHNMQEITEGVVPDPPYNQIPRQGGQFYWRQAYNAVNVGSTMVTTAMFDEMDEGTAIFKLAPTQASVPVQPGFVTLDADGFALPSDWYLQLAGGVSKAVRGETANTPTPPSPPPATLGAPPAARLPPREATVAPSGPHT